MLLRSFKIFGICKENFSIARLASFQERYFWVLPLLGFSLGWASFVLVQRGESLARAAALLALVGWPWILAEPFIMNHFMGKDNPRLATIISNFFSQAIQQEILFFTLPFLVAATHLEDMGQIAFTAFFIMVALVSTIDPVYDRYIYKYRIVSLSFHALCCFVSALVILPIVVKIPTDETLLFALAFVVVWLVLILPAVLHKLSLWKMRVAALLAICAIPVCIWLFRSSIPAAGILVNQAVITAEILDHMPVGSINTLTSAELNNGVYAYAAIRATTGLSQKIIFRWQHEDWQEDIPAVIIGGRAEGYRTYSLKKNFIEPAGGLWEVDILTNQGQLLQHLSFTVTEK